MARSRSSSRGSGSGRGSRRISSTEELADEYAYVIKDLRNILLLAAALFALLIALNLIL
jgi:hypothetical protein